MYHSITYTVRGKRLHSSNHFIAYSFRFHQQMYRFKPLTIASHTPSRVKDHSSNHFIAYSFRFHEQMYRFKPLTIASHNTIKGKRLHSSNHFIAYSFRFHPQMYRFKPLTCTIASHTPSRVKDSTVVIISLLTFLDFMNRCTGLNHLHVP